MSERIIPLNLRREKEDLKHDNAFHFKIDTWSL